MFKRKQNADLYKWYLFLPTLDQCVAQTSVNCGNIEQNLYHSELDFLFKENKLLKLREMQLFRGKFKKVLSTFLCQADKS